jgi:cob(I)alamin adenosyltransferase
LVKLKSRLRVIQGIDTGLVTKSKQEPSPKKGLIEVFTGNGRGKTSAAMGIVLRALGHDLRVFIVFFMKGKFPYGEQKVLARFPNVTFSVFGSLDFVDPRNVREKDREEARKALQAARDAMLSGKYDLIILDEVNVAAAWGLIGVEEVLNLMKDKPDTVELILTGRYADPRVVKQADLVTEMVAIKHPFDDGVKARAGLDY